MSLGSSIGVTDTGRRRRHNEDSYVCEPPLFAIADGMGGAQAGEVASRLAAAVLNEGTLGDLEGNGLGEARLAELIQEANRRVFQRSNEDAAASGMGTTMTVALVDGDAGTVAIGHVGDSRAYRVRGGELEQLTEDHSLVNELLKSGRLSPEEALSHPQRSVITRAIGTEPDVDVDTFTVDAQPGDLFLLCSDGLTDMITDEEILGLVERSERRSRVRSAPAGRGREPKRRRGQHHGRRLHDRGGRREAGERDADARAGDRGRGHALRARGSARRRHGRPLRRRRARAPRGAGVRSRRPQQPRRLLPLLLLDRPPRRDRRARRLGALPLTERNRELLTLVAVGLITAIGFASVYIARSEVVSTASLTYAGIFLGLYLASHLVARATVPYADPYLLPLAALLTAVGVTEIYRLEPDDAFRQALWVIIGVAFFAATLILLRRDYRRVEIYKYLFGLGSLVLLALPALPGIGQTINGARLWVKLGPLQFQPGELAKILLIVFLAGYLRDKREVLAQGRLKDFGPLLLIWGAAMLVLLQTNDLGSALLQFGIFLAMLYIATGRASFVAAGLALFLLGAAAVYQVVDHVQQRVTIWLQPWTEDPVYCAQTGAQALRQDCGSFQLVKSLYSIGNGGFGGTGLGQGTFTTTSGDPIIPFLNTDFIYSAIAQELGLVGSAALLLVYMLFVARGMRVALRADDGFSKLLAAGLTFGFALQTFIIVGGVLRVIPLTGITLPFVSYGGSSVVANFVLLAGLLLVSNRANAQHALR